MQEKNGFAGRKKILKSDFLRTKRKPLMDSYIWERLISGTFERPPEYIT
jgi:hypothetical protein